MSSHWVEDLFPPTYNLASVTVNDGRSVEINTRFNNRLRHGSKSCKTKDCKFSTRTPLDDTLTDLITETNPIGMIHFIFKLI